jgi:hypothetical protein
MTTEIQNILKELNIGTLLTIMAASWWFNRTLRADVKEIKEEIKSIHKEFKFINIRLSRVEGTVYGVDIYKEKEK